MNMSVKILPCFLILMILYTKSGLCQRSNQFNRIFSNFRSIDNTRTSNRIPTVSNNKKPSTTPAPTVRTVPTERVTSRPSTTSTTTETASAGFYYSWQDPNLGPHAKFTWGQAQRHCQRRGQQLVSLQTAEKNALITNKVDNDNVEYIWTSGRRQGAGWAWQTGETVQPLNWSTRGFTPRSQPDNREGNEDCLAILNRFYPGDGVTWHDVACRYRKPFICE